MKLYYKKLVRDKIPEIIEGSGKKANYRFITDEKEFKFLLAEKIIEEANELAAAIRNDDIDAVKEEIGDVTTVCTTIFRLYDISDYKFAVAVGEKDAEKGKFYRRIFLESVEDVEDAKD